MLHEEKQTIFLFLEIVIMVGISKNEPEHESSYTIALSKESIGFMRIFTLLQ